MSIMQEIYFIERLKNGDQEAYKSLVDKHQIQLMKLCKSFLHDDDDAKDITQETFIEVIKSIHAFKGNSKLSTWLYRIAVNKSLNLIRKRRYTSTFKTIGIILPGETDAHPEQHAVVHPELSIEQKERKRQIKKALDSLPKNQRIAFLLNKNLDLSYSEIAETMEISLSAVESLIHRAKKNLQQRLYHLHQKKIL